MFDFGENFTSPGSPTNAGWLFKTPDAFRNTLVWLHKRYNGPEVTQVQVHKAGYVTEEVALDASHTATHLLSLTPNP